MKLKNTMVYNENDASANPFMSMGTLNSEEYIETIGALTMRWTGGGDETWWCIFFGAGNTVMD